MPKSGKESAKEEVDKTLQDSANTEGLESLFSKIDSLVSRLEQSGVSLEESLTSFEEGMRLTKAAQSMLESVEQRVQVLSENTGDDEL